MISLIKLAVQKDPRKFQQLTRLMQASQAQEPKLKTEASEEQPAKQEPLEKQKDFFDEAEEPQSQRNTQADEANPIIETQEKRTSFVWIALRTLFWGSLGLFSYNLYLNHYTTDPGKELGYIKFFNDQAKEAEKTSKSLYDLMTKPPIDKLLPDIPPLPFGYEPRKTLILNLSGTLLKTDFVFGKGQEIMKRPGLSQFLKQLSQMYEVVILSNDDTMFVQTISQKLDPQHQIISGSFGRESLVLDRNRQVIPFSINERYEKDLKYLNRPLDKIIVIESSPDNLVEYSDNGIFINEFKGDTNDTTLLDLLPLLRHLSNPQIKDVRKEIQKFGNFNPQIKFQELRKIQESKIQNSTVVRAMNQLQQKNPMFQKSQFQEKRI